PQHSAAQYQKSRQIKKNLSRLLIHILLAECVTTQGMAMNCKNMSSLTPAKTLAVAAIVVA
ncbi:hypothetical protein, partial [Acidithiobacillus thiooxidans]|uniref:hypothetical protein n=1 Tax=Acidithiobacillus thiooxidans TaxID=930 RepID=UPI001C0693DB